MATLRQRAQTEGAPIIDGDQVTFVWLGNTPAPQLMGDFTGWQDRPITLQEAEPGVWTHTMTLPRDAYVEYAFIENVDIEERFPDPFNPHVIWNGVDSVNQVLMMRDYRPTDLTTRKSGVERGKITRYSIEAGRLLGSTHRDLFLYDPPTNQPVPLVVVWDGPDYMNRARLPAIVDNLIAEKRIRPIALAMIANGQHARNTEYFCSEATLAFLTEVMLPFIEKRLNLIDANGQPGIHGVLGASMGGLMALYTGLRLPGLFGRVVSQAGAFFGDDRTDSLIDTYIQGVPTRPIKIWQDCGRMDYLLPGNHRIRDLLRGKNYDVTYHEYSGGHNYTVWTDQLGRALETVYGVK